MPNNVPSRRDPSDRRTDLDVRYVAVVMCEAPSASRSCMTVDNDMGNRAEVVETTCDNDDDVDDDAAPAATTFAADTAMRRWVSSSCTI